MFKLTSLSSQCHIDCHIVSQGKSIQIHILTHSNKFILYSTDRWTKSRNWFQKLCMQTRLGNCLPIDPLGRPTVTAGSYHYFLTCFLYVHPSKNFSKSHKTKQLSSEISDRYWRDWGSSRVDHWWHTCLVSIYFMSYNCSCPGICRLPYKQV